MVCYSLLGQTVEWLKISAIHLFGLQGRRLRLVVTMACAMSLWVCYASLQYSLLSSTFVGHQPGLGSWLQSDIVFHLGSRPRSSRLRIRERHLLWAPPLHLASTWASDGQIVLFQWAFVMPFCLLRANKKSQTSDDWYLLPSQKTKITQPCLPSSVFTRCLNITCPMQAFSWFFTNQQRDSLLSTPGCPSLLQTSVSEEEILQIIAASHFWTASHSFISLKPLL